MPVAEGESLRDRLEREKTLSVGDAVRLASEVADALDHAHRHDVVHRDIKPENILLHEGHALVTDFGIGKALSSAAPGATLTQLGLAVGTPAYMSPEQAGGDANLDGRSDLYSLGCVLYEMLAGEVPFTGSTVAAVIAKRFTEKAPEVNTVRPSVPAAVSGVIRRCLEREAADRYATGAETVEALAKSVTPTSTATVTRVSGSDRARARLPWIAVLPFAGRDAEMAELGEGLAEDITNGLSRFSHLQVVARQSASHLPPGTDVRRIGETLGARYLVEGSIRKSGSTMRLSAQLVDAETGTHLWAETFDRDLGATSIFALQDELTDRIVATVADPFGVLVRVMAQPLLDRPVEELTASELCIRLYAHNQQLRPDEHARVRRGLELALEREPNHADAWANLATMYWGEEMHGLNPLPDPLGRARKAADRAVQIDSASQIAWEALAEVQYFSGDLTAFRQSAERAMALNPRNTSTVTVMAMLIAYSGEWDRGYELVRRAMALNPHHAGWFYFVPVHYHIKKGDYESALAAVKRVNMPEFPWTYTTTALICAALGRWEEARQATEALRRSFPAIALSVGRQPSGWFYDKELEARENAWLLKALALQDSPAAPAQTTQSVAVLPFTNMSGSPDDEYFSDGISEEIINALTQLPGLRVAARTSAFSFKGKNEDLRSVGEKLGVTSVLEGSVRKAGNRLRITAQLINVTDGYHLWSERYDRELTDIFAIQDEIAGAIASKLKLTMAAGQAGRAAKPPTQHLGAYELYLKGRALLYQRGRSIPRALACFEEAVALDPDYAQAWAGMADAYTTSGYSGFVPGVAVMPKALEAAHRALELDPELAEAHNALACATLIWNRDYERAEGEFKRAIAINPNYVQAQAWYGLFYLHWTAGRFREGHERLMAVCRNDPLSGYSHVIVAFSETVAGMGAEAIEHGRRGVELDPNSYLAHWSLMEAYSHAGRYEEAAAQAERALAISGRHVWALCGLVHIYAGWGKDEDARRTFAEVEERATHEYMQPCMLAYAAAAAGELEKAIGYADRAEREQDPLFVLLARLWPEYREMRKDSRFNAIVDRLQLPPERA